MNAIANCLGIVAVYYNILIALVMAATFLWLFYITDERKIYIRPWKYLFLAGLTFFIEEIFIFLRIHNILDTPIYLDGFFGIVIVTFFIYMLLLQKEYVKGLKK